MNKYYSFDDNLDSKSSSTPIIKYQPSELKPPITSTTNESVQSEKSECEKVYEISRPKSCEISCEQKVCEMERLEKSDLPTAWPVVVMAIGGLGLTIYTAIGPNIKANRVVFGFIFLLLWTIMWCFILWVLWKNRKYRETWWLLSISLILAAIFFMVVVILAI